MVRTGDGTRREGFTLIELMIVIAIIAVLASLLVSAVMRVLAWQARSETQSEITKMQQALEVSKGDYRGHPAFFPSRLILINTVSDYRDAKALSKTLGGDSKKIAIANQTAGVLRAMFGTRFMQSGNATWSSSKSYIELKGAECLVFYLGGINDGTRMSGFSRDPLNPTASGGERYGPFYQFKTSRLVASGDGYVYNDPYGTPFAYFGPASTNNYAPTAIYGSGGTNDDCKDLSYTDSLKNGPYFESTSKFLAPSMYQIISAGRDKLFGGGGSWSPTAGAPGTDTADNLANFSQSALGDPQS